MTNPSILDHLFHLLNENWTSLVNARKYRKKNFQYKYFSDQQNRLIRRLAEEIDELGQILISKTHPLRPNYQEIITDLKKGADFFVRYAVRVAQFKHRRATYDWIVDFITGDIDSIYMEYIEKYFQDVEVCFFGPLFNVQQPTLLTEIGDTQRIEWGTGYEADSEFQSEGDQFDYRVEIENEYNEYESDELPDWFVPGFHNENDIYLRSDEYRATQEEDMRIREMIREMQEEEDYW